MKCVKQPNKFYMIIALYYEKNKVKFNLMHYFLIKSKMNWLYSFTNSYNSKK